MNDKIKIENEIFMKYIHFRRENCDIWILISEKADKKPAKNHVSSILKMPHV